MFNLIFGNEIVVYAAYALIGASVFWVTLMLVREEESRAAQEKLDDSSGTPSSLLLLRIAKPIFSQYLVPVVRGKPKLDSKRKEWRRKLISAGLKEELNADEFIAFKIFLVFFFPIGFGFLNSFGLIDLDWPVVLLTGILGYFFPNFWVSQRIQARHKEVRKSLPFVVDLLALSTEAGSDFIGAISKVVEKAARSPLIDELEQLLKEIKVGSSRADALRELAARINMQEVNSFVSILISSDQMGSPIGRTLRQQSETIRSQRFIQAEKAGALAAQKLLVPMLLFIIPAVMLMIFGPLALSFLTAGGP